MYNQKKWFVLFAALFLGVAARIFVPESFVKTANAEAKWTEMTVELKDAEEVNVTFDLICAEDIWKQTFRELKYGEMTDEKLAAFALSVVSWH